MLHSVLIANEVEEVKRGDMSCLVFKVDYEKAHDSVSEDFLVYMLRRMGFYPKWITWVKGCLRSAFVSILINKSPLAEFFPQKGLR